MGGRRIGLLAALGFAALAIAWASGVLSDPTYRTNRYCLSYPRDAIRYEFRRYGTRGNPLFLVPSTIPKLNFRNIETAKGLGVSYTKDGYGTFTYRDIEGCTATDTGFGLLAYDIEPRGAARTPFGCPDGAHHHVYEVKPDDPEAGRIRITCAPEPAVPGCVMTDAMPNGWEASISLPRTHLANWREASTAARAFFASTLRDCGRA